MNRLGTLWESLRSSLWFVPALIVAASVGLAILLVDLESMRDWSSLADRWPMLFGGGADACRGLLAAIASSMITVAGVTFSITVVAMTLASSQYTSRILRNFMRDRANQAVLGVFVGVFAYCLVVLRSIRSESEGRFVPGFAVLGALLLAFVAIGFLIFFIHYIASSIQATSIIRSASNETLEAVDRLFPDSVGTVTVDSIESEDEADSPDVVWSAVLADNTGYIQGVDARALLQLAQARDVIIRMEKGIGEFVVEDTPLASVAGGQIDAKGSATLNAAYTLGRYRTIAQDAGFGIRQIVDIALKALSPGVNDTTTAIYCIDYLEAILARLATRRIEVPYRGLDAADLRLITRGQAFPSLLAESFDEIRRSAEGNVVVLMRMLAVLGVLAGLTTTERRRRAIAEQADWISEATARSVPSAHDRSAIEKAREHVATQLVSAAAKRTPAAEAN
ncbi:MAG: DUF2254 domain-containing protein [Planctomycetota bacterium]